MWESGVRQMLQEIGSNSCQDTYLDTTGDKSRRIPKHQVQSVQNVCAGTQSVLKYLLKQCLLIFFQFSDKLQAFSEKQ